MALDAAQNAPTRSATACYRSAHGSFGGDSATPNAPTLSRKRVPLCGQQGEGDPRPKNVNGHVDRSSQDQPIFQCGAGPLPRQTYFSANTGVCPALSAEGNGASGTLDEAHEVPLVPRDLLEGSSQALIRRDRCSICTPPPATCPSATGDMVRTSTRAYEARRPPPPAGQHPH